MAASLHTRTLTGSARKCYWITCETRTWKDVDRDYGNRRTPKSLAAPSALAGHAVGYISSRTLNLLNCLPATARRRAAISIFRQIEADALCCDVFQDP